MNKFLLILKQEYLKRVKKKSFIILTILTPLLFIGGFALIIYLSEKDDIEERSIAVYDESTLFLGELEELNKTSFHFIPQEKYLEVKKNLNETDYYGVLYIPADIYTNSNAELLSKQQIPMDLSDDIKRMLSQHIEKDKRNKVIAQTGIDDLEDRLKATETSVKLNTLKFSETGEAKKSSSGIAFGASYIMGFLIYMFVFMYGSMVMTSVMEEKKNRIVEVIISSVKPIQLMGGKIIGTALVGLTQVAIWVILLLVGLTVAQNFLSPESAQQIGQSVAEQQMAGSNAMQQAADSSQIQEAIEMINNLNLPLIIGSFLFFFLFGYLLYSSMMGAVGAAVDNQEDSQQLMLPVTIPLIIAIMLLFPISRNPEGQIAFWGSIFPLTSPIAMLARIPYGVPTWELVLSMGLLIATTIGVIWMAAKIYRTGLLMYGKKVNFKELWKWLRY